MTRTILMTTAALAVLAGPALAEEPPAAPAPAAPAFGPDPDRDGVLIFRPEFFAASRPNTALDMVNRIPGFGVDDGSGARGFEGAVGNVLINGSRPASKNDTGSNVLSRTTADRVDRIELIRGGVPGIDMQGYTAVVNVILKSTASRESILTANATLFDGGQNLFGGSYQFTARDGERTWGVTLSDGISMSDANGEGPVIRRAADGTILRDEVTWNDEYGGSRGIRGTYASPLLGGKIDLTARVGESDWNAIMHQTGTGVRRDNLYANDETSGEIGVVYSRPLAGRWSMESRFIHEYTDFENASVSNSTIDGVASPEVRFASDGTYGETILRGLTRFQQSEAMTLELGGEVAYNRLETAQAYTVGGENIPLPSASLTVEETRGELFGKGVVRLRPNLNVEAGIRLESSTISQSGDADHEESFFFVKPRFLATWTPWENHQLTFRLERTVGQLDFGDFAASADLDDDNVYGGNVNLSPEQRWESEVAYEYRFWTDGIIKLAYRHDEISDVIDRIPLDDGLSAVGNIGDGTLDQLAVDITIPTDRLGISGGRLGFRNTWNHTEVTDPTTGEIRAISGIRASQPVISFEQDITSWRTQWGVAFIPTLGQTNYDPDETNGWRGANYFEGFVEYKPTASLSIRAQLNVWNDFEIQRTVYADRDPRTVAFTENRYIDPRTFVSLRVRKTF